MLLESYLALVNSSKEMAGFSAVCDKICIFSLPSGKDSRIDENRKTGPAKLFATDN